MYIGPNVPAIVLDPEQPEYLTTFIVLGPGHASKVKDHASTPGRIKAVRFSRNTDSPLLSIEWKIRGGRRIGVDGLHMSGAEQRMGSEFLADVYRDEGRTADYEAFLSREKAAAQGRKVGDLPDEYLPAKVLKLRGDDARGEDVFQLPPKAAAEKPQRRRSESAPAPETSPGG